MKRLTVCLVIVLVLVGATLVYADTTGMIGKVVDQVYPVYVNGVELSTQAISINGTSYIPTRAVATALGASVTFQNGQIDVTTEGVSNTATQSTDQASQGAQLVAVKVHFNGIDTKTDPDNKFFAQNRDGGWYVESGAFGVYAGWDGQQATVSMPGHNTVTVPRDQAYQTGIDGFQSVGRIFFNLSALGFTATLNGDTLDIQ